jgi:hypothetical protein
MVNPMDPKPTGPKTDEKKPAGLGENPSGPIPTPRTPPLGLDPAKVNLEAPAVIVGRANPADVLLTDTPEGRAALAEGGNREHTVPTTNQPPVRTEQGLQEIGGVNVQPPVGIDNTFMLTLYHEHAAISGYVGDWPSQSDSFQRAFRHVVKRAFEEGKRSA